MAERICPRCSRKLNPNISKGIVTGYHCSNCLIVTPPSLMYSDLVGRVVEWRERTWCIGTPDSREGEINYEKPKSN
jgi:hypothetical protein